MMNLTLNMITLQCDFSSELNMTLITGTNLLIHYLY